MVEIIPVPAFEDNYIWLMTYRGHAAVVDPGDAQPVLKVLREKNLQLDAILITHHHSDHIGGVHALLEAYPAIVYAPYSDRYPFPHHVVREGDTLRLTQLNVAMQVLETPGHTLDHIAYLGENALFCGDTLFGCGCGRLFEGDCRQLYHTLQRLAALPPETRVYCAHEYTLHNIRFALSIDPDNQALQLRQTRDAALRADARPTLPSTIAIELETNPFLRCHTAALQKHASKTDPEGIFCAIRTLRNSF
jgi:hydroxyacylglutathione hydrolase